MASAEMAEKGEQTYLKNAQTALSEVSQFFCSLFG
jgi:hypothetical protein